MGPQASSDAGRGRPEPSPWPRRHRPLGWAAAAVAAGMAGVWLVVVPGKAEETTGVQELAIRWGHPACWALLAVVGVLVAVDAPRRTRDAVAITAAACYAGFIAGMVL